MGEARKLLPSEKVRLPDVTIPHPMATKLNPKPRRILGHGAQLQEKRLAAKAKALDSGTRV